MVSIEPIQLDDYVTVANWLNEPENNQWLASEWRGRAITEKTLAVVCMNAKNRLYLIRVDGTPAGVVALSGVDKVDHTAMLWYVLGDKQFAGQGVTTQAVAELVEIAFSELGLCSLSASVMEPNIASARVLEKNSFQRVGVLRNAFCLADEQVNRLVYDRLPL